VASLIPTRFGNGALEALAEGGAFSAPRLVTLEEALGYGVHLRRGRVFADLWDLEKFSDCGHCFSERRARLERINRTQEVEAPSVAVVARVALPRRGCSRDPRMRADFDMAVIGSGFGGSLLAMIARRLGRSVVLLERGRHPRFAIGESSTPLANLLLEELAQRYELTPVAPLAKWKSWQKTHPEIACGLKRGFTFYHHVFGQRCTDAASTAINFWSRPARTTASPTPTGIAPISITSVCGQRRRLAPSSSMK